MKNMINPIQTEYNKRSILVTNETVILYGNRGTLFGIPDELKRVQIDGMTEVSMIEDIKDESQFAVDYNGTGSIFVHKNFADDSLIVREYYSKGTTYYPASRIWTKIDSLGNVIETLQDVIEKIEDIEKLEEDVNKVKEEVELLLEELKHKLIESEELYEKSKELIAEIDDMHGEIQFMIDSLQAVIDLAKEKEDEIITILNDISNIKADVDESVIIATSKITEINALILEVKRISDKANDILKQLLEAITKAEELIPKLNGIIEIAIKTDETLTITLEKAEDIEGRLSDIIEGTDFEEIIEKLGTIEEQMDNVLGEVENIRAEVDKALVDAHTHTNKSTLDKLSEDDNGLLYNGEEVGKVQSVYGKSGNVMPSKSDISGSLGFVPEDASQRGIAYPKLSSDGYLLDINIPLKYKQQTYMVGSVSDMNEIKDIINGDICFVRDDSVIYLRDGEQWKKASDNDIELDWESITGKPESFEPSPHTHNWDSIEEKPLVFPPEKHSHAWSTITNKPSTFTPSIHSHTKSEVGLSNVDNVKQAPATRTISAGTGLTGGGSLSANRTLSVNFGTSSTQVARGNHTHSGFGPSFRATGTFEAEYNDGDSVNIRIDYPENTRLIFFYFNLKAVTGKAVPDAGAMVVDLYTGKVLPIGVRDIANSSTPEIKFIGGDERGYFHWTEPLGSNRMYVDLVPTVYSSSNYMRLSGKMIESEHWGNSRDIRFTYVAV